MDTETAFWPANMNSSGSWAKNAVLVAKGLACSLFSIGYRRDTNTPPKWHQNLQSIGNAVTHSTYIQMDCFQHVSSMLSQLYPVSILICVRLNLSLPWYHIITQSSSYASSLAHHFPSRNVMEKVLMPENIPKPSMFPVTSHFQYVPSSLGMYQHLFICHLLHPTDFQHPPPRLHFKCFKKFVFCLLVLVKSMSLLHTVLHSKLCSL